MQGPFVDEWLLPFCAAVWSLDREHALDGMDGEFFFSFFLKNYRLTKCKAIALLTFLDNHGFLSWSTVEWLVPAKRSIAEVDALLAPLVKQFLFIIYMIIYYQFLLFNFSNHYKQSSHFYINLFFFFLSSHFYLNLFFFFELICFFKCKYLAQL